MLKDYINWMDKAGGIVVKDNENQRFFSRPLTKGEESYIMSRNYKAVDIPSWPQEKKQAETKRFKKLVESTK